MIVTWENQIQPNTQSDHICASWDIMPTLCEVAGIHSPNTDGVSFVPALLGEKQPQHRYLYWEFPERDGSIAVRKNEWKLLIQNASNPEKASVELFNLEKDQREQNNVANDNPEIVEEMKQYIRESHTTPKVDRFRMAYFSE